MTAFWSAMVRNCMRQLQIKRSEKVDLQNYANSLKDRISLLQEEQNSIWQQSEQISSAKYLAASNKIQQSIAQIQGNDKLDTTTKNTQVQALYADLQAQKTKADMEMQQLKRMWEQGQREQLKPLQNEQTRIESDQQKIDEDIERLKMQKDDYVALNKESNQDFYGGNKA